MLTGGKEQVQEVVLLADFQCPKCQKRVADIISRMNEETESVEVSVSEKKVILTFTRIFKVPASSAKQVQQLPEIRKNASDKFAIIKRLFRSKAVD